MRKILRVAASPMILLIVLQWAVVKAQQELDFQYPEPTGPFQVGTTSFHWVDESREETLTEDNMTDKRELVADVWYPASVQEDLQPAPYWENAAIEMPALRSALSSVPPRIMLRGTEFEGIDSYSYANVPVAGETERYPVVLFSPGWGGIPRLYSIQFEELASHGYVVVALNHPYETAITLFPDGREVRMAPLIEPDPLIPIMAADISFALDQLEALDNGEAGLFAGRLDMNEIGLYGHSLGGWAVGLALFEDSRLKAGMTQDGALTGTAMQAGLDQPFMYLAGEDLSLAGGNPRRIDSFENFRGSTYLLTLLDFAHLNFTDGALWGIRFPLVGTVDEGRAIEVINSYLVAFFDQTLKGIESPLLQGASADYPEVDFQSNGL